MFAVHDRDGRWRLLAYLGFVAYGFWRFHASPGDDLSSSYIGCRLLAGGGGQNLYDHDPAIFHVVDSAAWKAAAAAAPFDGFLHPYVHTPLWAWSLRPLCMSLSFSVFNALFVALALIAICALVELVARHWAPKFLEFKAVVLLLGLLALTTPFAYSLFLTQTHALFLALAVAALVAADRDRPALAGAALALAAAVKITPGFLVVYWLVKGQGKAAAWFVAASALLLGATALEVGLDVTRDYFASMRRLSDVLLISFNNQSLAAWLAYTPADFGDLQRWRIQPLSESLKLVSMAASLLSVALAGGFARATDDRGAAAGFALVAVTVFSPIAWSHYYLALLPAVMVLVQRGGAVDLAAVAAIFLLDIPPLAVDPLGPAFGPLVIVRSHLLAGALAMGALLWPVAKPEASG